MTHPAPPDINKRLGRAIHHRRTTLGMTQQDIGKAIGTSTQQIHKYEKGANQLTVARAEQIARALDWSVAGMLETALRKQQEPVSERRTLAFIKWFSTLHTDERRGIIQFVQRFAEAA